ncbi:MAG: hypothetical protein ACI4JC_05655, partial [Faecalibacterium sp.]
GTVTPAPHGPYRAYKVRRNLPYANKKHGLCVCTGRLKSFCPAFFKKREKKKAFSVPFSRKRNKTPYPYIA